jgi:phage gp29-like protein
MGVQSGQLGSQLNWVLSQFDGTVFNPDSISVQEYQRMLDTDETVGAAFDFLVLVVLTMLGEYHHENPQIAQFVHDALEQMKGSFIRTLEDMLSYLWAGFSVTEIVWNPEGTTVKLEKLATYHPATISFRVDDSGNLKEIVQRRLFAAQEAVIPPDKAVLLVRGGRFGNLYGQSLFKRIRKNWLLKDAFLKMWGRALDKFGTPLVVAVVPDAEVKDPETGEDIHQLDYAVKVLANLQNGTALAFAKSADQAPDIKALTTGGAGVGEAFSQAIQYLNKMICRGLLIPSLVIDEGMRTGSYALGASHFDAFYLAARAIYQDLTENLLEQLIRRLIDYNFGPQTDYGTFTEQPPDAESMKLYAEAFRQLVDAGFLDPQVAEDLRWARSKLGLPDREPASVVAQAAVDAFPRYLRAPEGGEE